MNQIKSGSNKSKDVRKLTAKHKKPERSNDISKDQPHTTASAFQMIEDFTRPVKNTKKKKSLKKKEDSLKHKKKTTKKKKSVKKDKKNLVTANDKPEAPRSNKGPLALTEEAIKARQAKEGRPVRVYTKCQHCVDKGVKECYIPNAAIPKHLQEKHGVTGYVSVRKQKKRRAESPKSFESSGPPTKKMHVVQVPNTSGSGYVSVAADARREVPHVSAMARPGVRSNSDLSPVIHAPITSHPVTVPVSAASPTLTRAPNSRHDGPTVPEKEMEDSVRRIVEILRPELMAAGSGDVQSLGRLMSYIEMLCKSGLELTQSIKSSIPASVQVVHASVPLQKHVLEQVSTSTTPIVLPVRTLFSDPPPVRTVAPPPVNIAGISQNEVRDVSDVQQDLRAIVATPVLEQGILSLRDEKEIVCDDANVRDKSPEEKTPDTTTIRHSSVLDFATTEPRTFTEPYENDDLWEDNGGGLSQFPLFLSQDNIARCSHCYHAYTPDGENKLHMCVNQCHAWICSSCLSQHGRSLSPILCATCSINRDPTMSGISFL